MPCAGDLLCFGLAAGCTNNLRDLGERVGCLPWIGCMVCCVVFSRDRMLFYHIFLNYFYNFT